MNNDIINIYLLSSEWEMSHRKLFVKTLSRRIGKTVAVQYPVSLTLNLFYKFRERLLGLILGKYKAKNADDYITLFTPFMLFHKILWQKLKFFATIDSMLIGLQVNRFIKKHYSGKKINLWLYTPSDYYLIKKIKYSYLFYDYYDDSEYDYNGNIIQGNVELNKLLVPRCNLIVCVSKFTTDKMLLLNKNSIRTVNGFDPEIFSANKNRYKTEIDNLDKPIIGYTGVLRNWLDFDILKDILEKLDVYLVCVGFVNRNFKDEFLKLKEYQNFIHIGFCSYEKVSSYIKKFNIGILPYRINNFMKSVYPNKFFEYMAEGIEIVSSSLPELEQYQDVIAYARDKNEFINYCKMILEGSYKCNISKYENILKRNTWDSVFDQIESKFQEIYSNDKV